MSMIIFFGLAGSGKSTQAELLADKMGWVHVSAGELLRMIDDPLLKAAMEKGDLVDPTTVNKIIAYVYDKIRDKGSSIILDGYPRQLEQAQWLLDNQKDYPVELAVLIDVPESEIKRRLALRAREDDTADAVDKRIKVFYEETQPVIDAFEAQGIKVIKVDARPPIEEVHQKVMELVLKQWPSK